MQDVQVISNRILSLITAEMIVQERRKDLLAEAARYRLANAASIGKPSVRSRWRHRIGDLLIHTGRRLKNGNRRRLQPDT